MRTIAGAILAALLAGCTNPYMFHYHRTVVGLDMSANIADQSPSGHLTLGYSRKLVVIVPKKLVAPDPVPASPASQGQPGQGAAPTPGAGEVLSSVFCTQVRARLKGVSSFREVLATGDAAIGYADSIQLPTPLDPTKLGPNRVCPEFSGGD